VRPEDFITTNAALMAPPLVPELKLYLATEVMPLWRLTEEELSEQGVPPPYWAFAWAGGQALARYILDNPGTVKGKRVLDIGAGSGMVGLAAVKSGAKSVLAADIDEFAVSAIKLNAAANKLDIMITRENLIGGACDWDVVLVGDLFYERPLVEALLGWLRPRTDTIVLMGDPGRNYFPKSGVEKRATYNVQTTRDLEDREIRETSVYRLLKQG